MSIATPPPATKVTFGLPSLLKKTPQIATTVATLSLYLAAVLNLVFISFPQIPAPLKTTVAQYSLEAVTFIHAICNMFGLQATGPNMSAIQNKQ